MSNLALHKSDQNDKLHFFNRDEDHAFMADMCQVQHLVQIDGPFDDTYI